MAAPLRLRNRYFALRHGRSLANEARVICSAPKRGVLPEFALAPLGREQACAAGTALKASLGDAARPPLVYASPFSRTQETARLAVEQLGDGRVEIVTETALRERYFGDGLEGQPDSRYADVWAADEADVCSLPSGQERANGETVMDVAARLGAFIARIEAAHGGREVLLVGHGDTLQIAQVVLHARAAGREQPSVDEARRHRSFAMETGELREVQV